VLDCRNVKWLLAKNLPVGIEIVKPIRPQDIHLLLPAFPLHLVMDLSSFYFHSKPIEESLSEVDRKELYQHVSEKKYSRGVQIFEQGNYPKGVFILKRGRVKIYQSASSGDEQIIAIHSVGEMFGYRPILSGERYPVSATTLEPCSILFIPKKDFVKVIGISPSLSNMLLRYLSREFTVWVNMMSIRSRTTAKERLLLNILVLSEHYREQGTWPIKIALPKSDLACLIGTSNETLARMLKILKQEKIVVSRGSRMEINGPEQLRKIQRAVSVFI
jgi:CRP-like cAMP-binding protein